MGCASCRPSQSLRHHRPTLLSRISSNCKTRVSNRVSSRDVELLQAPEEKSIRLRTLDVSLNLAKSDAMCADELQELVFEDWKGQEPSATPGRQRLGLITAVSAIDRYSAEPAAIAAVARHVALVSRTSPEACKISQNSALAVHHGSTKLLLSSHPGLAITPQRNTWRKSGSLFRVDLGVGAVEDALEISYDGAFLVGAGGWVLDCLDWKPTVGTRVQLIYAPDPSCLFRRPALGKGPQRQFIINTDGSVSPCHAPHLALGFWSEKSRAFEAETALDPWQHWLLRKKIIITIQACTLVFRCADNLLDILKAIRFCICGSAIFASLTILFILVNPLVQYFYIRKARGHGMCALLHLIPGSYAHIRNQARHIRVLMQLSQAAIFQEVHKQIGVGALSGVLSGIECVSESIPQAGVQACACAYEQCDWLDAASIGFSLTGSVMGVYFAWKVLTNPITSKHHLWEVVASLSVESGHAIALGGRSIDQQTWVALYEAALSFVELEEWDLTETNVSDDFVITISQSCPKLRKLILSFNENSITDTAIQFVAVNCQNLCMLRLTSCIKITDCSIGKIALHCAALDDLDVKACNRVTDASIGLLAVHCTMLKHLNVGGLEDVTDASIQTVIASCPRLQHLFVSGCGVSKNSVDMAAWYRLPLLSLGVTGCADISDSSIIAVAEQCPTLEVLDVDGCVGVTDRSITVVSRRCVGIKKLFVACCPGVTEASLKQLPESCAIFV